ncbi:MAG TPA: C40 family peptidase [Pseudolysinimonas sp.]|nr:C40 family peptidase [Pseudolysinimonas sp.]
MLPGKSRGSSRPTGRRAATPEARIAEVQASYGSSFRRADRKKRSPLLNMAIMAVVVPGLFCTVALPAYAFQEQATNSADAELQALKESGAQTVRVGDDVVAAAVKRDTYKVTSAAEMRRAALAAEYRSWSGPSVADFLKNPPYPRFDLNQVVAVAKKYQGVPYRYGGDNPAGFDCSGFTQYVYAQFGVSLPHSSSRQGQGAGGGAIISPSAALPGDLVVMDGGGHVGIYLGGNMMIDAPRPGTVVEVRGIYNPNHWFVRYGI